MQRPTILPIKDIKNEPDSLEDHPLFTPDLEYFTPPTILSPMPLIDNNNTNAYDPRTLTSYNLERQTVLPVFPPCSSLTTSAHLANASNLDNLQPALLLCNVPKANLSQLQLASRAPNAYLATFEFIERNLQMIDPKKDSFMNSIYRQLLYDLSMKWHIDMSLLDYNLARLRQCAKKCLEQLQQQQRQEQLQLLPHLPTTATFSIEELPLALEFYLQVDVDLFYFKTCWFRQAIPVDENIFCSKAPEIHYSLTACNKPHCLCCHPLHARIYPGQEEAIQFNLKKRYEFVNGYQSILNCPATCETTDIIYTLTCPCKQVDYVGTTAMSLRDCLTIHRRESNRIVREFIFGPTTTSHILQGIKSEEARRNDQMWLYQHIARCPTAIQIFLDANPDYWCLVPMPREEVERRINTRIPPSYRRTLNSLRPLRTEADATYLADNLPDPPDSFSFTERQKYGQMVFFRQMKDNLLSPRPETHVDLFNATIVAVLPQTCSEMLRQLLLSLFITHADCHLNKTGRLINDINYHQYPVRGFWCANLVRRPLSSLI